MPRLALGLCALWIIPSLAAAQPAGNVTLDAFRPAIDSRGYLTVNASAVLGDGEAAFGLGALAWGHGLLRLDGAGRTYSIDDMVTATLIGAVGWHVAGVPLELGASLPLRIMSGSRGPGDRSRFALDGQGLGNAGLHGKLQLGRAAGFGLGVLASVYLPTSTPEDRFLGDHQVVPQLVGAIDRELGAWRFAVNAGLRLRRTTTFTNDDPGPRMAPVTGGSITAGSELPFGAAVAWAVAPQRFELIGEVFGALPLGAHHGYQPLEALAGVKLYLARSSYLTLGAGRGLVTDQGASPAIRAVIAIVFEPGRGAAGGVRIPDPPPAPPVAPAGVADRDGDRIPDELDACPDEPEDFDGFEDADGCPDPDNDRDRILDVDDLCPDQPETYNNVEDADGCPDEGVTRKVEGGIQILQPIQFEYDRAVIKPDSYYILDAVVATLNGYPDILRLEVQGHTDERGDAAYNLALSERRAAAVVSYLVEHGVAAARLSSQGYGETQPIDRRHGETAWRVNRRVDFVIR